MTLAIILAVIASFIWALSNHVDKYLVCKVSKKSTIEGLMIFSTLIAGIISIPFALIYSNFNLNADIISITFALLAAVFAIISYYLYYKALEKNDTTVVVVVFQLIPVFSFLISLILFKEMLKINEIIGAIIIIISAMTMSLNFKESKVKHKNTGTLLMIGASLCYAIYYEFYEVSMNNSSYEATMNYFLIGITLLRSRAYIYKKIQEELS